LLEGHREDACAVVDAGAGHQRPGQREVPAAGGGRELDPLEEALARGDGVPASPRPQPVRHRHVRPFPRLGRFAAGTVPPGPEGDRPAGVAPDGAPGARGLVRDAFLGVDAPAGDRLREERSRAVQIAVLPEQHVYDLAGVINGTVQVRPLPTDPDVGFIDVPAGADATGVPPAFRLALAANPSMRIHLQSLAARRAP
jgi:hypothetical protein